MTTVVGAEAQWLFTVPYLTVDEYKRAPTAVDVTNLHRGGTQQQQDAELANVIARASGWANVICMQNLAATIDTETGRVRENRRGEIYVAPRYWPILEVQSFFLGSTPADLVQVPLTGTALVDRDSFTIFDSAAILTTSVGPLQLGAIRPDWPMIAQWTYVNGWPTTTLTQTALANATTLHVASTTGCYPGNSITLYDGANTETVNVSAVPSSTTLTLSPGCAFAHSTTGISVSALPPIVKEATIKLTSALVKSRGSEAVVMRSLQSGPSDREKVTGAQSDALDGAEMLRPFRVIR